MARPMPLVDPVTTADLPFSWLPICLPQHFDVHDPVLVVRLRGARESELAVEFFQVLLRADAKRVARPQRLGALDRLAHELPPRSRAASLLRREHAADRRLAVLHARRNEP